MIVVTESHYKAWFPLDPNRIMQFMQVPAQRLITIESKYLTEIGSDLQPKRFSL